MKTMKYIILPNGPVIFPETFNHSDFDKNGLAATPAGFCRLSDNENRVIVWGKSISLGLESKPTDVDKLGLMIFGLEEIDRKHL